VKVLALGSCFVLKESRSFYSSSRNSEDQAGGNLEVQQEHMKTRFNKQTDHSALTLSIITRYLGLGKAG